MVTLDRRNKGDETGKGGHKGKDRVVRLIPDGSYPDNLDSLFRGIVTPGFNQLQQSFDTNRLIKILFHQLSGSLSHFIDLALSRVKQSACCFYQVLGSEEVKQGTIFSIFDKFLDGRRV